MRFLVKLGATIQEKIKMLSEEDFYLYSPPSTTFSICASAHCSI